MSSRIGHHETLQTPPPRPPPPVVSTRPSPVQTARLNSHQNQQGRAASASLLTDVSRLPSYEDVIPRSQSRRGSDGDCSPSMHRTQRTRSLRHRRKPSKRRIRPEIRIVSSQPMHEHPAFADGSKGSCVPPEAPPSYDEAMRVQSSDSHILASSTSAIPTPTPRSRRRISSDIHSGTDLVRASTINVTQRDNGLNLSDLVSTSRATTSTSAHLQEQELLIDLSPPRTSELNRTRNNSEIVPSQLLSRSQFSIVTTSSCATSSPSETPLLVTTTSIHLNSKQEQTIEQPCLEPSTNLRQAKPTVPPKHSGLSDRIKNKPGITCQRSSTITSGSLSSGKDHSHSSVSAAYRSHIKDMSTKEHTNGDVSSKIKPAPRKLPPPPRPPSGPPTPNSTNSLISSDEANGYASIIARTQSGSNMKPPIQAKPRSIRRSAHSGSEDSLVAKLPVSCEQSVKQLDSVASTPETEPTYAQVNKPLKEPAAKAADVPLHNNSEISSLSLGSSDNFDHSVLSTSSDHDVSNGEIPPPIPASRPLPDDFIGMLVDVAPSATQEIEDVFGSTAQTAQNMSVKATPPIPVPRNNNPVGVAKEVDVDSSSLANTSSDGDSMSQLLTCDSTVEPAYEEIVFKTSNKTKTSKPPPPKHPPRRPPPKPTSDHLPAPPTPNFKSSKPKECPPLPAIDPVGNVQGERIAVGAGTSGSSHSLDTRNENSSSKGLNLKLKNLKLSSKPLKKLMRNSSSSGAEGGGNNNTKKNPSSPLPPSHHRRLSKDSDMSKTSPVQAPKTPSTPTSNIEKPKRTPPPRPTMPLALQNKAKKSGPPSSLPSESNVPSATSMDTLPAELSTGASSPAARPLNIESPPHHIPSRPPPMKASHPKLNSHLTSFDKIEHSDDDKYQSETDVPLPKPRITKNAEQTSVALRKESTTTNDENLITFTQPVVITAPKVTKAASMNRPSRPPPPAVKAAQSFKMDSKGKPLRPAQPPSIQEGEEKEEALFDLLTKGARNAKKTTDEQMKQFISEEMECVAVQDYQAMNFTDLSFAAGDLITVIKRIDQDLLFGRNEEGEEGPFPEEYVRVKTMELNLNNSNSVHVPHKIANNRNSNNSNSATINSPLPVERLKTKPGCSDWTSKKHVALFDYKSGSRGDLNFNVGDHIEILEEVDVEWLKGRIGNAVGIFPKSYVSLSNHTSCDSSVKSKPFFTTALYDFNSVHDNELSFSAHDKIEIFCRIDDEWLKGRRVAGGLMGIFPLSHVEKTNCKIPMECEVSSSSVKELNSKNSQRNVSQPSKRVSVLAQVGSEEILSTAVTLHEFVGQDSTELSFQPNQVISITRKVNENWYEGELNGNTGIFPAAFVQMNQRAIELNTRK